MKAMLSKICVRVLLPTLLVTCATLVAAQTSAPPWNAEGNDRWAFQPVRRYEIPSIKESVVKSPIDAFIVQKLSEKGMKFAPPADRVTLIRRATYDLLGLPPTPQEVDAFVNDRARDAFDKVIERLLASPHYGEQWGRHWLDVVRYADTDGYSNDYERPNAWRYRDYVVRSFNQDRPYDQFVVEQIAGDELTPLPSPPPPGVKEHEGVLATGFLRMGPWEHTGMSVAAVTRQLFLDDVTNAVGTAFLALPLNCARCHDHKFDPIPTRDYYRMQAMFAPAQFEERPVAFLPGENTTSFEQAKTRVDERTRLNQARLQELNDKPRKLLEALLKEHDVRAVKDLPAAVRPQDNRIGLDAADQERQRVYRKRLEYYERELKRYEPVAFGVVSSAQAPPDTFMLVRGMLSTPGERVAPGVLTAFSGSAGASPSLTDAPRGRRLHLARWIASPDHPLTARVMANRLWQWHFGRGLVETSNNFGKMGKRPTHPELLDWLATYFVEHGWSVKEMHRLIMKSAVYQQTSDGNGSNGRVGDGEQRRPGSVSPIRPLAHSPIPSVVDPANALLSHFPPRRLTAEELRDSILHVAGELSVAAGGPGTFPEINESVALQPRQIMGTIAPAYEPSPRREQRHRRSIHTFQQRGLANPFLEVFNAANSNTSCEFREATTITPQVFTLFNSEFSHDMALAMAQRLMNMTRDRPAQVNLAFRLAYARPPTQRERALCLKHFASMLEPHRRTQPVTTARAQRIVRHHIAELTGQAFDIEEDLDLRNYEPNLNPADVSAETRALAEVCLVLLNANEFVYVY